MKSVKMLALNVNNESQQHSSYFFVSELYKDIPIDLPPEARLRKLFDACLKVFTIMYVLLQHWIRIWQWQYSNLKGTFIIFLLFVIELEHQF